VRRLRRQVAAEDGFTLIEMLVAAIVLVIGIGGAVTVLASTNHASSAAERHSVGIDQAQNVIENARSLPYAQVGLNGSSWTSAGLGATDPTARVSGSNFTPVTGASNESLIVPGANGVPSPGLQPYRQVTVGSGGSAVTAKIYTFVSWRRESCGVIGGSTLGLLSVSQLDSILGNLNTLLGSGNTSLNSLSANVLAVINGSGLLNVVAGLLGTVSGIKTVGHLLTDGGFLTSTMASLTSVRNSLTTLRGALNGVGNLNLCNLDLSVLSDLKQQLGIISNAGTTSVHLGDLNSLVSLTGTVNVGSTNGFSSLLNVNCGLLGLGCLIGSPNALLIGNVNTNVNINANGSSLKNSLNALVGGLTGVPAAVSSLTSDVNALTASATNTTPRSSKRVTVAVVLDPAGKVGPLQPIWESTVVTDPQAGLL
jgi:prepilin-type N-terminal cleavage/methylation domain-containing protein